MKGRGEDAGEGLEPSERERIDARYRGFVEAAAGLRGLVGPEVEPCWATELEARP